MTWRTTIAKMGGEPTIGITAATRKAAALERGQRVSITIEEDLAPRLVDVPADFAKAMGRRCAPDSKP